MTKLFKIAQYLKFSESLTLSVVYTLGHVLIAMSVVKIMTGASLWEAGAVALIEPAINGVWFYILHRSWVSFNK